MKDVERKEMEEDLTQVTNSSLDSNPHHNSMLLMPALLEIKVQKSGGAEKFVQESTAQICAKLSLQHHPLKHCHISPNFLYKNKNFDCEN